MCFFKPNFLKARNVMAEIGLCFSEANSQSCKTTVSFPAQQLQSHKLLSFWPRRGGGRISKTRPFISFRV